LQVGPSHLEEKVELTVIVPLPLTVNSIEPFTLSELAASIRSVPACFDPCRLHSMWISCLPREEERMVRVQALSSAPNAMALSSSSFLKQFWVTVVCGPWLALIRSSILAR